MGVPEAIFTWAHNKNIDLSAEYILGSLNITADLASREKDFNKEWRLMPTVFHDVCRLYGVPAVDIFASRINTHSVTTFLFLET